MEPLTLSFPPPGTPLSINKANRMHWAAKMRELDPWREATAWAWIEQRKHWGLVKGKPCTVQIVLPFRTNQRRDPHNYSSTVGKAIVDALVRQDVWLDDTPEWVTFLDPIIQIGGDVQIILTPR